VAWLLSKRYFQERKSAEKRCIEYFGILMPNYWVLQKCLCASYGQLVTVYIIYIILVFLSIDIYIYTYIFVFFLVEAALELSLTAAVATCKVRKVRMA
jgi:hypothetical protein